MCGTPLAPATGAAEAGVDSAPAAAAQGPERRRLTVVFCDLVGSTALSQRLDPEEFRDIVSEYHATCAEIVGRFGGHVAQYLGDGVLAYFGYPRAHEDDASRAVRAGLGILDAIGSVAVGSAPSVGALQVRVGIHTGVTVVGEADDGRSGSLALGDVLNIAARLQAVAAPDTLVIGDTTYRLVAGYFACEPLGAVKLKGVAEPVEVYRVVEEGEVQTRFDLAVVTGLTPLVGREEEVAFVLSRWEKVKAGRGQVVLVGGEAGIGKSRLLRVVRERTAGGPHVDISGRCAAQFQNSALHPVIETLRAFLQLQHHDAPAVKLEKIERRMARYGFTEADTVPLLAALLSLPHPEGHPPLALTPQKQKQKTLETLVAWLLEEAVQRPVRLVVEDLHWADPSTLDLLGLLAASISEAAICVVLTHRPEFAPPWKPRAQTSVLTLGRLERADVEDMVRNVTGGRTLPRVVLREIVEKTDGVPLYVEEFTKTVIESRWLREVDGAFELTGPLPPLAIPSTLHDSLMARLDLLGSFREVALIGATLGREFSYDLIRAVAQLDERSLRRGLEGLVDAELLFQRGSPPHARYAFKHALVQHTAYEALLKRRRQEFHQRIAEILEAQFPETVETQPEVVAHHFTGAGLSERAVGYWTRAGQSALARSAYVEAVHHLETGLRLLEDVPASAERSEQEIALRSALGVGLVTTKGYAAPEVERNCSAAHALCRQLGDGPRLLPTIYGLWSYHLLRDHRKEAFEFADRLSELAKTPEQLFLAATVRGSTEFWHGALRSAEGHLARATEMYAPDFERAFAHGFSEDVPVLAHAYHTWCLFHLGEAERARAQCRRLHEVAARFVSPYVAATTLAFEVGLWQSLREVEATREAADRAIALSTEQQFPTFLAGGLCARGWVAVEEGNVAEGIARMQQGLAIFEAAGLLLGLPYWKSHLVEASLRLERADTDALMAIVDAALASPDSLTRYYDPELYRLRGQMLRRADRAEAERAFRTALRIAEEREAGALALAAAIALADLVRTAEASSLLAATCVRVRAGGSTRELADAERLLRELPGPTR